MKLIEEILIRGLLALIGLMMWALAYHATALACNCREPMGVAVFLGFAFILVIGGLFLPFSNPNKT